MTTKYAPSGKIIPKKFSIATLEEARECNEGFCVACGASKDCCEPDARKYPVSYTHLTLPTIYSV